MRYMGGKGRIAKVVARVIARVAELHGLDSMEDRFCGGLAVAKACADIGLKVRAVEDGNPALVVCYQAISDGSWQPPGEVTREDYAAIRNRGDIYDPVTAFVLAFCSFSGKWGAGRHPDDERWISPTSRRAAAVARRDLLAMRPMLEAAEIREGDCLGPCPGAVLYADIPYEGTLGYTAAPPWNRAAGIARLWLRAQEGPVLVSEATTLGPGWRPAWTGETPLRGLRSQGAQEHIWTTGVTLGIDPLQLLPSGHQLDLLRQQGV